MADERFFGARRRLGCAPPDRLRAEEPAPWPPAPLRQIPVELNRLIVILRSCQAVCAQCDCTRAEHPLILLAAVGLELRDVGPQVVDLLVVLDAGEDHLGARDHGLRIVDVFLEVRLVPDDA